MSDYESRAEDAKREVWEESHTGICDWCGKEISSPYGGTCSRCSDLHDVQVGYPEVRELVEEIKRMTRLLPSNITILPDGTRKLAGLAYRFPNVEEP